MGVGFTFSDVVFSPDFVSLPHSGKDTDPEEEEEIVSKEQISLHIGQCSRRQRECRE